MLLQVARFLSLLWLSDSLSIHINHSFFVHSFVMDTGSSHIMCCYVNNAAVSMWVHVSFELAFLFFFPSKYPEVKLLDHTVILFLIFE